MGICMMLWFGTTAEATMAEGLYGSTLFLARFVLTTVYALFVSESA